MHRALTLLLSALAIIATLSGSAALAAEPAIPNYWDERERLPKPDLSGVERLRFLTTIDFPPFSFLDAQGRLAGFHVDLAREVCRELDIVARCQIQGLPWDELDAAMAAGQGEALIAGTPINAQTRERYLFSRPYLRFPARFVVRKSTTLYEPLHKAIDGKRTGVLAGTAHEAMLRQYFPAAKAVTFTKSEWMEAALREGRIDGIFGDGMRLSFWLAGSASENCCRFAGGPYLAPEFLGAGLAIAANREDTVLARAFDFALREISVKGTFAELYLKYFPVSFY
ncbi:MAG: transporter substrate-binding domain-containing protein [Aquamicrobium sp.]|nr:transporter substrate-binding domain-containing protein [Aquamicrobium sp.]